MIPLGGSAVDCGGRQRVSDMAWADEDEVSVCSGEDEVEVLVRRELGQLPDRNSVPACL